MNKKVIISFALFFFVFCFLGLPFSSWWFNGDDFSCIALGKTMQSWQTLWSHFIEGNVNKYFYPSHHQFYTPYGAATIHKLNFLSVYFRPIHCAYFACAYWLFGLNAYAYYLVSVFLHALNTTILFNILTWFSGWPSALFFALLFALHPQIGFRFGAPANFQYYLNVLLLMLTIIMLNYFLDRRQYIYLLFSTLFFTIALFTRETAIVFPAILFGGCWLYQKKISWAPVAHGLAALGYLAIRIWLYPFHKLFQGGAGGPAGNSHLGDGWSGLLYNFTISSAFTIFSKITSRFNEVLVCIYDSLSLSWLPYGHKCLRLSLLLIATLVIAILFWRNKHKFLLLFLGASYLLMLWPSLFGAYSPRYFHEASPFLFVLFAVLSTSIYSFFRGKRPIPIRKYINVIITIVCTALIGLCAFFTYTNLRTRETKLFTMKKAFLALANDQRITSGTRPLCFLAFPLDGFGTGIEQAAWLFLTPPTNPVYYDPSTMLTQNNSNVLEHAGWYMRCAPYYTKNYFTITNTPTSVRLTSTNPQKINFSLSDNYLSLGAKTVHQSVLGIVTDLTLTFDQKHLKQKPLVITLDYEKQQFVAHE